MPCNEQFVTSLIVSGVIFLVTVTAVATVHDGKNAFNILAFIGGLFLLFVHALAMCGFIIKKDKPDDLGKWPKLMHIFALVPASLFVLFSPWGSGVDTWLRFIALLLGIAMFWEHTAAFNGTGLYGREAQTRKTGLFSE